MGTTIGWIGWPAMLAGVRMGTSNVGVYVTWMEALGVPFLFLPRGHAPFGTVAALGVDRVRRP
jgi:hypothetical protein